MVKNQPAMQEAGVRTLSRQDLLEKEMATYSCILVWEIPLIEATWWPTVHGVTKSLTGYSN